MSDSRGEVAYLMADISCVKEEEIKCLYDNLESLTCKLSCPFPSGAPVLT